MFEVGLGHVFLPLVLPVGKCCKWRAAVHQLTDLFFVMLVTELFEKNILIMKSNHKKLFRYF